MNGLRGLLAAALLLAAVCAVPAAAGEQRLVLVAGAATPLSPLSPAELSRLFLGMPVQRGDLPLRAVINRTRERSYQLFLQAVMGMSASTYERRLLGRLYRKGVTPPPMMRDFEALLSTVERTPGAVTFVLADRLPGGRRLQVVQELWRGPVQ